MAAIDQVAAAHPNPDPALIRAARAEFAKELDGTHAAEDGAWWRAHLSAGYSEWPQTPFSDSVKTAFDHVLTLRERPLGTGRTRLRARESGHLQSRPEPPARS